MLSYNVLKEKLEKDDLKEKLREALSERSEVKFKQIIAKEVNERRQVMETVYRNRRRVTQSELVREVLRDVVLAYEEIMYEEAKDAFLRKVKRQEKERT